jgi:hypothetical protein
MAIAIACSTGIILITETAANAGLNPKNHAEPAHRA